MTDDLESRIEALEAAVLNFARMNFGDSPGHPFRGNQYTDGGGGGEREKSASDAKKPGDGVRATRAKAADSAAKERWTKGLSDAEKDIQDLYGVKVSGDGKTATAKGLDWMVNTDYDISGKDRVFNANSVFKEMDLDLKATVGTKANGVETVNITGSPKDMFDFLFEYDNGDLPQGELPRGLEFD